MAGGVDQILPDATTSTLYMMTNLSWKKKSVEQNHSNTFTPCQEHALTTGHPNPLLLISSRTIFLSLYSLQGEWNSEAGRGVQCVVSKFRMYFRALEREKTAGMGEEWRMRGVGAQWTKSAELDYIRFGLSGSVPNKSLLSLKGLHRRWIKPNSESITKGGKA